MSFPTRDVEDLDVSQIHSFLNDPHIFEVVKDFEFPSDFETIIPRRDDRASTAPTGFTAIYVEQLRLGLRFPNPVRVVLCYSFFVINSSTPRGWYCFASRRGLRVGVLNHVSDWKKRFFYFLVSSNKSFPIS